MSDMSLKILCVIIDRAKTDILIDILEKSTANYIHVLRAIGTARTEILEMFGLNNNEKSVILASVQSDRLPVVYDYLRSEEDVLKKGSGIAFTMPVSSVGGPATLRILSGIDKGER